MESIPLNTSENHDLLRFPKGVCCWICLFPSLRHFRHLFKNSDFRALVLPTSPVALRPHIPTYTSLRGSAVKSAGRTVSYSKKQISQLQSGIVIVPFDVIDVPLHQATLPSPPTTLFTDRFFPGNSFLT